MLTLQKTGTALTALAVFTLAGAAARPASGQSATFNFNTDAAGTMTTFTDTNNGLSATFSSTAGPGAFMVQPSFFSNQSGNDLGAVVGANSVPLDIAFSKGLNSFSLNFGLNGAAASTFTLTAFSGGLNGAQVGSKTVTGAIPGGFFLLPEGSLSFQSASPFDTVALTSTAQNLFVDNIAVSAPVPEDSTAVSLGLMVALGACGIAVATRRRKANQTGI